MFDSPPALPLPASFWGESSGSPAGARPVRSPDELAVRADNTEIVMQWSPSVVLELLSTSEILEVLETQPPTDRTVTLAVRLGQRVLDELDASRLLTVWIRIDSWVTAQMDKAIVTVAGADLGNSFDPGREEAALAMRVASRTAASRVMDARERRGRLIAVGDALERGVLLARQSQDMVEALEFVSSAGCPRRSTGCCNRSKARLRNGSRRKPMRAVP
ncbi:MAG: hypothetical protein QOG52_2972, partial [Frankiaceae bacterium]|nr:hypothetical protein [Frankiaceae bacterium]